MKQKTLTVRDLKIFLPFGINLDPYIKKVIRDEYVSLAAQEGSETGFGWFTNYKGVHQREEVSTNDKPGQELQRVVSRKITQDMKQTHPDVFQGHSVGALGVPSVTSSGL